MKNKYKKVFTLGEVIKIPILISEIISVLEWETVVVASVRTAARNNIEIFYAKYLEILFA